MADGEEVPEIEEDKDEYEYGNNNHHLITHHNTHQESERIRREYSAKLQDLEHQQYYDKVDRTLEFAILSTGCPIQPTRVENNSKNTSSNTTENHWGAAPIIWQRMRKGTMRRIA